MSPEVAKTDLLQHEVLIKGSGCSGKDHNLRFSGSVSQPFEHMMTYRSDSDFLSDVEITAENHPPQRLTPSQLKHLADTFVATDDPQAAARLEEDLIRGFYGEEGPVAKDPDGG